MLLRRLIKIFSLTFTVSFSSINYAAHAFPFGRIAQEFISLMHKIAQEMPQQRTSAKSHPEANLPPKDLRRASIHIARNPKCGREESRCEITPSFEDCFRLMDPKAPA